MYCMIVIQGKQDEVYLLPTTDLLLTYYQPILHPTASKLKKLKAYFLPT